jgi:hypothetical protein
MSAAILMAAGVTVRQMLLRASAARKTAEPSRASPSAVSRPAARRICGNCSVHPCITRSLSGCAPGCMRHVFIDGSR